MQEQTTDASVVSYAFKASLIGTAHRFELTEAGLSWRLAGRSGTWPYTDISAIRLSFRPVWMQAHRFRADISHKSGARFSIVSTSWQTAALMATQDNGYRDFLIALHRRMAASGSTDSHPDDYKRISIVVSPVGGHRTTPTVQQTFLIYETATHPPAVSCLSVSATCPGTNQTYSSGTQVTLNVTTTALAASVEWLVNGSLPTSSQLSSGATDPYTPSSKSSSFTWVLPSTDGTYTISALAYDLNGNAGTKTSLQLSLNRHQAIAPTSVTTGYNNQIGGADIQWVPSVDQDIRYYNVYSQVGLGLPTLVCSAVSGTSCYDLTAPSPLPEPSTCQSPPQSFTTTHYYWVVGVDTNPLTGLPRESTATSPKVDANLCDHPPTAPTNLAPTTLSGGQVQLSWTAPSDPDSGDSVAYWRIYRFTGSSPNFPGGRYDLIGALNSSGNQVTSYTDQSPDPGGVTQNYCVTAVDTHLNESPCSNVVTG